MTWPGISKLLRCPTLTILMLLQLWQEWYLEVLLCTSVQVNHVKQASWQLHEVTKATYSFQALWKLTLAFKLLAQLQLVTLSFLRHDFCSNSSTRCHVSSWRAIYPIVQLQTSKKQAMKALPNKWLVAVARWLLRWKSPMNLTYRMNP